MAFRLLHEDEWQKRSGESMENRKKEGAMAETRSEEKDLTLKGGKRGNDRLSFNPDTQDLEVYQKIAESGRGDRGGNKKKQRKIGRGKVVESGILQPF